MRFLLFLFLLCSFSLFSKDLPVIVVDADKIKEKTMELFFDSAEVVDLNGNNSIDSIVYTYSDFPPKLTFDVTVDGEKKYIGLICNSIGIFKGKNKGMRSIFCGPKTKLIWNGYKYISK